MSVALKAPSAM